MDQALLQESKKALEQEHDKLVAELNSLAKPDPRLKENWNADFPQFEPAEYGSHASLDEEADEIEEYETMLEAEHSLESRLLEVNRALERMVKGVYGKCLKCGAEIPVKRLRANPAAEFDMEHSSG